MKNQESTSNENKWLDNITLYKTARYDEIEEALEYLTSLFKDFDVKIFKTKEDSNGNMSIAVSGTDSELDALTDMYIENFNDIKDSCDLDAMGWTDPDDIKYYTEKGSAELRKSLYGESKKSENRDSDDYLKEIYDSLESAWDKSKFNLSKGYNPYYDCQCVRVSLKENPNFYSLTYVIEPGDANYVADRPASFQTVWRYPNDHGVGVGEELEFQSTDFDEFGKSVFDYFDELKEWSARKNSSESKKNENGNTPKDEVLRIMRVLSKKDKVGQYIDMDEVKDILDDLTERFEFHFRFQDGWNSFVFNIHEDPDGNPDDDDEASKWNTCAELTDEIMEMLGIPQGKMLNAHIGENWEAIQWELYDGCIESNYIPEGSNESKQTKKNEDGKTPKDESAGPMKHGQDCYLFICDDPNYQVSFRGEDGYVYTFFVKSSNEQEAIEDAFHEYGFEHNMRVKGQASNMDDDPNYICCNAFNDFIPKESVLVDPYGEDNGIHIKTYRVPEYLLSAIVNGEREGLSKEDLKELRDVYKDIRSKKLDGVNPVIDPHGEYWDVDNYGEVLCSATTGRLKQTKPKESQQTKKNEDTIADMVIQVRKPGQKWSLYTVTWPEYVDMYKKEATEERGWPEVRVLKRGFNGRMDVIDGPEESKKSEANDDNWVAYYFCKDPQGLEWAVLPHTANQIGNVNCLSERGGMDTIGMEYVLSKCTPVENLKDSKIYKAAINGEDRRIVPLKKADAERIFKSKNGLEELKAVVGGKAGESKKSEDTRVGKFTIMPKDTSRKQAGIRAYQTRLSEMGFKSNLHNNGDYTHDYIKEIGKIPGATVYVGTIDNFQKNTQEYQYEAELYMENEKGIRSNIEYMPFAITDISDGMQRKMYFNRLNALINKGTDFVNNYESSESHKKSEDTSVIHVNGENGNVDIYSINSVAINSDGSEDYLDDMATAKTYYDEDEAIKDAKELSDSYKDDDRVVQVFVTAGEYEKPNGDIGGEPFDIFTASSSDRDTTAKYRKLAGYAGNANIDYYAK